MSMANRKRTRWRKPMIDEVMMLRHGRTQYNLEHRLQGQIDVPLDIVGQWQVDQTGFALASRYYWAKVNRLAEHPEAIAQPGPDAAERTDTRQFEEAPAAGRRMVVMTSDLFRAQQTAHAFADILGLPVTCDQRLRERSFGEWEGMTRAEIKAVAADDYASWKQHTGANQAWCGKPCRRGAARCRCRARTGHRLRLFRQHAHHADARHPWLMDYRHHLQPART